MKEIVAIFATLLAIAGNVPYLWSIVRGTVRPHPYTWLVGTIVSATVFFGILAKGAGIGALPVAASEVFTVIIFLFSLKFGFDDITHKDRIFLAIALAALIPWLLMHDPTLTIVIAVSIDVLSFLPTFRKTIANPSTEMPILYGSNVLRHVLVLYSLATYNIATTFHSIAMICMNTAMIFIILFPRKK